jgi:uncharacterized protein YlaI
MKKSKSNYLSGKKCELCGSNKTDIINEKGTLVFNWLRNPFRKGTWMCGRCHRRAKYMNARLGALTRIRKLSRRERE